MNQPPIDPVRPQLRRGRAGADHAGAARRLPDPRRGHPHAGLGPHRARGRRAVGHRAGRSRAGGRRRAVRPPDARDHGARRRRGDRVPGRAGRASRPRPAGPRGRARCGPRPSRSCTTRRRPAPPIRRPRWARSRRSVGALYLLDTVSSIAGIDVRTDEWGVDLNMTGSQKCLAAPLGLSLVSVSAARVGGHGAAQGQAPTSLAYDLLRWKEWWIPVSRGRQGAGRRRRAVSRSRSPPTSPRRCAWRRG